MLELGHFPQRFQGLVGAATGLHQSCFKTSRETFRTLGRCLAKDHALAISVSGFRAGQSISPYTAGTPGARGRAKMPLRVYGPA